MDRTYDLFEKCADGSLMWCCAIDGLNDVFVKLQELGSSSSNEYFAMDISSREIVGRVNASEQTAQQSALSPEGLFH